MYPRCGVSPVDLDLFPALTGVLDVVYNPLRTALVLAAEDRGIPCSGGLPMLDGYSDWATAAIPAAIKSMWYRFSRRGSDYCIECSEDGIHFRQMRICHMDKGSDTVKFGIYACSPEDSSFKAVFTNIEFTECQWKAHDGQQPDS